MTEKTKPELARRLKLPEDDLLSRDQVAALIPDLVAGTLLTKPAQHVGFFKLGDKQTSRRAYRKDWVLTYAEWRIKGRDRGYDRWEKEEGKLKIGFGEQAWPGEPEPEKLSFNQISLMIDRWKQRELYRRIELICGGEHSSDELRGVWRAEARQIFDPKGQKRPQGDPSLKPILIEKAEEIIQPTRMSFHPERLTGIIQLAWEQVLETERGWLEKMPP
jgi:hypothetical protein